MLKCNQIFVIKGNKAGFCGFIACKSVKKLWTELSLEHIELASKIVALR